MTISGRRSGGRDRESTRREQFLNFGDAGPHELSRTEWWAQRVLTPTTRVPRVDGDVPSGQPTEVTSRTESEYALADMVPLPRQLRFSVVLPRVPA